MLFTSFLFIAHFTQLNEVAGDEEANENANGKSGKEGGHAASGRIIFFHHGIYTVYKYALCLAHGVDIFMDLLS